MRDGQSLAVFAFVQSHDADRYLLLLRLLSSGRARQTFCRNQQWKPLARVTLSRKYLGPREVESFRVRGKLLCATSGANALSELLGDLPVSLTRTMRDLPFKEKAGLNKHSSVQILERPCRLISKY
jgi:hypothetical protein